MDKPIKVLVLGANGFIGSHLVDALAAQPGLKVVAFDRFSRSAQYKAQPNIEQVKADIFNSDDVLTALQAVDYVIHAFSATTPYSADLDPYSDIDKNILNTVRILELCVKQKIKKVMYISSGGAIYGSSAENGAIAAETDQTLPISPYGISKLATERYLAYFERKYGLQHVSYRLTNPYGPRQVTKHNQGVVPRFVASIVQGKAITIYGNGSSSRDYIFIEDAVAMIVDSFATCKQQVYNIGSGQQTSVQALVEAIERQLATTAIIEYLPEPTTFVHSAQLSVSRFTAEFGERTLVDMAIGLDKTIASLSLKAV
jgi:UDP-glucose 4-epimerase